MSTLAIMQPYFMPYLGYFQLIAAVDKFLFYDDVNYIKRGWVNRNYILNNGKKYLLTIPCKAASQNKLINNVFIDGQEKNITKILSGIQHSYAKSKFYEELFPQIKHIIQDNSNNSISQLNIDLIVFFANYLGLNTSFKISSENQAASKGLDKQERLIEICKNTGSDHYINALGGQELYSKEEFKENGVLLDFLQPVFEKYPQKSEDFIPGLSILDVLMNVEPDFVREHLLNFKLI